jgi:hypothetical protein
MFKPDLMLSKQWPCIYIAQLLDNTDILRFLKLKLHNSEQVKAENRQSAKTRRSDHIEFPKFSQFFTMQIHWNWNLESEIH